MSTPKTKKQPTKPSSPVDENKAPTPENGTTVAKYEGKMASPRRSVRIHKKRLEERERLRAQEFEEEKKNRCVRFAKRPWVRWFTVETPSTPTPEPINWRVTDKEYYDRWNEKEDESLIKNFHTSQIDRMNQEQVLQVLFLARAKSLIGSMGQKPLRSANEKAFCQYNVHRVNLVPLRKQILSRLQKEDKRLNASLPVTSASEKEEA